MTFDELADKLVPELLEWALLDESCANHMRNDLRKVLQGSDPDGYRLAIRFSSLGYEPDAELVKLLDQYYFDINDYMRNQRGLK